mmetsp:Transcript_145331/g.464418  ORF Transcript_145331/g.464418 Transcript_145331/m.464418 type:complete len:1369 (-) Transcript_145331:97-4203(-)
MESALLAMVVEEMSNLLFGRVGTITGKAEAMDTLGSVSSATREAKVVMPATPPSESALKDALSGVAMSGDTFATLAAVSAVASTGADGGGASDAFAESMMDYILNSGALTDATPEAITASSQALTSILSASLKGKTTGGSGKTAAVSMAVAKQAASLVLSLASAAGGLAAGLDTDTATALVGSVGTLFSAVSRSSTASTSSSNMTAAESAAAAKAEKAQQQALSSQLRSAASTIGDSVLKAVAVGVVVEIFGALSMKMKKETPGSLAKASSAVGGFDLPPLPSSLFAEAARRLAASSSTCSNGGNIGMHHTIWPSNPFSYAGSSSSATLTPPADLTPVSSRTMRQTLQPECCSVEEDAVQSMDLRMCGQTLAVENLDDNITFFVNLPRRSNDTANFTEARICQYFDETAQEWTSRGCSVINSTNDSIQCGCNHLSAFTGALGSFKLLSESLTLVLMCANTDVLSPKGLSNLGRGAWWYHPSTIVLWLVVLTFIVVTLIAVIRTNRRAQTLGISRHKVATAMLAVDHSLNAQKKASWRRMEIAAARHDVSWLRALVMWQVQVAINGPYVELEEFSVLSSKDALLAYITVAFMRLLVSAQVGVLGQDSRVLEYMAWQGEGDRRRTENSEGHSENAENPFKKRRSQAMSDISKVSDTMEHRLQEVRKQIMAPKFSASREHFFTLYRAVHPVLRTTHLSVTMWVSMQSLALALNVFGTFAVTALFLQSSSVDLSSADAAECAEQGFWENLIRDVMISIISSVIAVVPPTLLLMLHRLPMSTKGEASDPGQNERIARANRWRPLQDVLLMIVGLAWLVLCFLLTMSFLANVRGSDADHWLVSALTMLVKSWLLIPAGIACFWLFLAATVSSSETHRKNVDQVLAKAMEKEPNQKRRQPLPEHPPRDRPNFGDADFQNWVNQWMDQNQSVAALRDALGPTPPPPPPMPPPLPVPASSPPVADLPPEVNKKGKKKPSRMATNQRQGLPSLPALIESAWEQPDASELGPPPLPGLGRLPPPPPAPPLPKLSRKEKGAGPPAGVSLPPHDDSFEAFALAFQNEAQAHKADDDLGPPPMDDGSGYRIEPLPSWSATTLGPPPLPPLPALPALARGGWPGFVPAELGPPTEDLLPPPLGPPQAQLAAHPFAALDAQAWHAPSHAQALALVPLDLGPPPAGKSMPPVPLPPLGGGEDYGPPPLEDLGPPSSFGPPRSSMALQDKAPSLGPPPLPAMPSLPGMLGDDGDSPGGSMGPPPPLHALAGAPLSLNRLPPLVAPSAAAAAPHTWGLPPPLPSLGAALAPPPLPPARSVLGLPPPIEVLRLPPVPAEFDLEPPPLGDDAGSSVPGSLPSLGPPPPMPEGHAASRLSERRPALGPPS